MKSAKKDSQLKFIIFFGATQLKILLTLIWLWTTKFLEIEQVPNFSWIAILCLYVYRFWFHSLLILRIFFKWLKKTYTVRSLVLFTFIYIVFNLFRFFKYLHRKHGKHFFFSIRRGKIKICIGLVITYYIKLLFMENIVYSVELCSDWLTCKQTVAIEMSHYIVLIFLFFLTETIWY